MLPGKIIDLTLPYSDKIAGYSDEPVRTLDQDGWNARTLHIYSHAGTHMDAPTHFGALDFTMDQFPPERFMGRAWVVGVDGIAPSALITVGHLGEVAGKVQPGDALLFRTGWSRFINQPDLYRNRLPRLSEDLARWCVDKQVNLIGVEPPSVADVNNLEEVTRIHLILLRANIIIVEGLTNLDQIKKDQVFLIVLPLKIAGGDGAPARAIAIEQENENSKA
jgi:arylformamidase